MDLCALTNHTYRKSRQQLMRYRDIDGSIRPGRGGGSIDRFVRAGYYAGKYDHRRDGEVVHYAFDVLRKVKSGSYTKWSIVYDLKNLAVHFKTSAHSGIKSIEVGKIDFSCSSLVLALQVNRKISGDCTNRLYKFSVRTNRKLVAGTFRKTFFLQGVTGDMLKEIGRYPETCVCR